MINSEVNGIGSKIGTGIGIIHNFSDETCCFGLFSWFLFDTSDNRASAITSIWSSEEVEIDGLVREDCLEFVAAWKGVAECGFDGWLKNYKVFFF